MSKTAFVVLLDRSGSMAGIKSDIVGGLNQLVKDQNAVQGVENDIIFMAQFDTEYEVLKEWTKFSDLKEFPEESFKPRGSTALYDAMDRAIDDAGSYFRSLKESDRPTKIMFITLTDGFENASRKATKKSVSDKIKHQKEKYSWDFSFIGANFDVFAEGTGMGMHALNTMSYDTSSSASIRGMSASLSKGMTMYRTTASSLMFAQDDNDTTDNTNKTS